MYVVGDKKISQLKYCQVKYFKELFQIKIFKLYLRNTVTRKKL